VSYPITIQHEHFNRVFDSWRRAIASIKIRFVSIFVENKWILYSAQIELLPFECKEEVANIVSTKQLSAGEIFRSITPVEVADLMKSARLGRVSIGDAVLELPHGHEISFYVPAMPNEPEYFVPQIEIRSGSQIAHSHSFDYAQCNAELRCGDIPFDGAYDLFTFFGISNTGQLPSELKISVKIYPPADLILDRCGLTENKLKLELVRRTSFDRERVKVGLRQFPDPSLLRRKQIASQLVWFPHEDGFERGVLEVELDDCATAELMVSVSGFTVRRWFLFDPHKSLNPRLTDYRYFDPNLVQLRKYLSSSKDARQLEVGIAALLHLLGAASLNPPGSDSPDVLVETLGKRLALIECTTRVDNVREKAAKLVSRRDGLVSTEYKYGITRDVMAILLVNQPLTSLVNEQSFLLEHQVVLLTLEDIESALSHLEIPVDLDQLYIRKRESMQSTQLNLFAS